jgi:MFS family permease
MEDVEKRVIGKVMRRLIPFLILCYFVAYLDRVNVSFAKLHMNQALGFSDAAFGLGAGLFFIAYFLFEVPSNIFLERVGARPHHDLMGDRLSCVRLYSIDRQLEFRTKGFSIPFVCYSAHSRPVSSRVSSSI